MLLLLLTCVTHAWADDATGHTINYPYFYYYNSGNWTNCAAIFGRQKWENNWTDCWNLSNVTNTKLYYAELQTYWNNTYNEIAVLNVVKAGNDWKGEGSDIESRWGYATNGEHTDNVVKDYNLNYHETYLWDGVGASTLTHVSSNQSTGYTGLNHSQTVKKYTTTNGTTYSEASVNSGTVTISAYKMTGYNTASNASNSATMDEASETTASKDAAYTSTVTMTASANSGYVFMGWYADGNGGDPLETSTTYTYSAPYEAKTVYARFAPKYTVGSTLYLRVGSNWTASSPRFAAVFCNATTQTWVNCTAVSGATDFYSVTVPSGNWGCVIFCRMPGNNATNNWATRWTQTSDMFYTASSNKVFVPHNASTSGTVTGEWLIAGYESSNNGIKYVTTGDPVNWTFNGQSAQTTDLNTVTNLYLKEWFTYEYENRDVWTAKLDGDHSTWTGINNSVINYNIHRTAVSPGAYTTIAKNWVVNENWDGGGYKRSKAGNNNQNINLLDGLGSGKYTMSFYYYDPDLHITSPTHTLKWTIGVPAMGTHTCTSDGSGDGQSGTPFTKSVGSNLTITVAGTQASTDANSVLYVSFDGGEYTTTTTHTINSITSTKESITVKAKYRNATDNLDGTVYDFGTIYYQGTLVPSLAISSFTQDASTVTSANAGETVTINASRENAETAEITYEYSTDNSNWTTIGTTTSTTQSWTLPAATSTITYYVKASMTYDATGYSDTKTFKVYGKKTIKVKDTNGWGANFKIHRWGGDRPSTSYPGETANISSAGGQWKQVVLYSSNTDFIFCNGESTEIADANKTENQEYADLTDNGCYEIESGSKAGLTLNSTANCPAKPSVSASAATSLTNTTATINGNISSNGNDAIKDYGFYWGTSSTPGTKVSKGTSDKTGAISHNLTGLTAGTTYYYQAYATNGQGETKSTPVQSFVVPYSVTISTATGCSAITPGTGTQYIKVGDVITATAADGYEFSSWSLSSVTLSSPTTTDGETSSTVTAASNGGTIQPVYTAKTYTGVTLDKNTGSSDGAYSVTYLDNKITVTTTPAKTGYHVDGYYAEAGTTTHIATAAGALQSGKSGYTDGSGRWNQAGGKKLYTKWAANTYTAENNIDGNGGSAGKYTATYDATNIAINTAPTRTGYNLTGYHAWGREANTLANTAGALSANQSENKTGGKTLTNSSSQWIYDGSDATIYADWSPKTYSISLDQEGGASGSTSVTMTYDASTHTAITNPSKTGYTFAGYWTGDNGTGSLVIATDGTLQANVSTYTGAEGIWKKDATCTLYAKWTPNDYAVMLSTTGETGYGSNAPANQTATYGAAMPTITPPVGAAGYKFQGYFTAANGAGTQYYNANGTSAHEWDIASASTLHAYFQKTVISTLEHPASIAKGDVVTLDVNPVLNQTGATDYMDICWSLLYDNDNPVESGVAIERYATLEKPNQVRFTLTGLSAGYYKVKAVLKANASSFDACDAGTELSTFKSNVRIAGNSNVTILYQDASGNTIHENGSIEVARGETVEVTAPEIIGYAFDTWVLGDVLATDDALTANPISISAEYDGHLTAKYNRKNTIYFKNTLNWPAVYVNLLDAGYWNENGSGNNGHSNRNLEMTRLGESDIWYYEYDGKTANAYVSFTSVVQNGDGAGAGNFWGADTEVENEKVKVVYPTRPNYDANERTAYGFHVNTPMFVPLAGQTAKEMNVNAGGRAYYYNQGYWTKYEPVSKETGYTLKIFNKKNNAAEPDAGSAPVLVKSVPFVFDGDMTFPVSVTVDLEAGKWYGFKLYRDKGNEGDALSWYGNSGNMSNQHSGDFSKGETVWEFKTTLTDNCGLKTNSAGDYVFTLAYGKEAFEDSIQYLIGVHYPEATGDYRLVYSDDNRTGILSTTIPFNSEHDTVSFFINKDANPVLKMQKCEVSYSDETSTVAWTDTIANLFSGGLPSSITAKGVYYFCINKNPETGKKELGDIKLYEGNFYIRTDGATPSKWDNFRQNNHLMAYSDYADLHENFTHSWTQWYDLTYRRNLKFTVANDYSVSISDTLIREALSGQWTNIDDYIDENGDLNRQANVRFMYNSKTNAISRAYIDGAYADGGNFLKIWARTQDSIYAAAEGGDPLTEITFTDNGNWLYEQTVFAQPGARYKLRSLFGTTDGGKQVITQYFKGGAGSTAADSATMIGGDGSSRMQIRLLYDFKTNRVVTAYQPSGTIDENLAIRADIMFMREHQEDIEQITFASGKSITEIENIYCGLRFNKWTLNNKSKEAGHATLSPLLSRYERDIFYVSFPYDVRLSDVIGFGTYGQHWIVEYYDGAARAKNGFWIDSDSYWKFVTPSMKDTFTLKAGTGYIVALDLDELYYISNEVHAKIWDNTDITNLELLFPGKVSSISNVDVTYNMPSHECKINRGTASGNRTIKDSHWNVLGVPTFKNITGQASGEPDEGVGSGEIVFANTAWVKDSLKLKFIYDGNLADNSLTPKVVKDFEFKAMHAYVVQYCGNVTFTTSATPAPASVAARTYAEEPIDVNFRLELNKDGVVEDQTFVSLSNAENASADFKFGEDMSKEFNSNRANIYTFIGTEWVAGNTLPLTNQTTIVPVGVKIAADGEYTFSIPEGTYGVGITLIDNEAGARVNLGLMDYTVTLAAGQIDDRFVLEISPISQSPTGVELLNGENGENGVRKVLIDNILYIVKDGKVFDAQGRRL